MCQGHFKILKNLIKKCFAGLWVIKTKIENSIIYTKHCFFLIGDSILQRHKTSPVLIWAKKFLVRYATKIKGVSISKKKKRYLWSCFFVLAVVNWVYVANFIYVHLFGWPAECTRWEVIFFNNWPWLRELINFKQTSFIFPGSPRMEGVLDLHHDICFWLVLIVVFVLFLLMCLVFPTTQSTRVGLPLTIQHQTLLELVWIFIPCLVLISVAVESFSLLYSVDLCSYESIDQIITVIGHQWYWSYQIKGNQVSDGAPAYATFDSRLIAEQDLLVLPHTCGLRLLEVDERLNLPAKRELCFFVTAADVLHSWAIPALGIKIDACPGRLNRVSLWINSPGVYYGQCSEICGIQHAYMPIVIHAHDDSMGWSCL